MRDYAKVEPKEWHGDIFKALRRRGSEALLVGLYLTTSPQSNMLGLFQQPILYMAHETGLGEQGARKGLQGCIEAGFCAYDEDTEVVWVYDMARTQIAPELKAEDNRCKGVQKAYDALPENPFLGAFFDAYWEAFHLTKRRDFGNPRQGSLLAPPQAPPKPRTRTGAGTRTGEGTENPSGSSSSAKLPTCPYDEIVRLYHEVLPKAQFHGVRVVDDARKEVMRKCWQWILTSNRSDGTRRAETAEEALSWLREFFERAMENDFLMGRVPRSEKHRNWKPDIEYLLKPAGIKQVLERTDGDDADDDEGVAQGSVAEVTT